MRRAVLSGIGVALAAAAVAGGAVIALDATVFSPSALVREYLGALDRADVDGALALPGVDPGADVDRSLLVAGAADLPPITEVTELGRDGDTATVRISWGGTDAGSAELALVRTANRALLFSGWAFAEPPIGTVQLSVRNAETVRIGTVEVTEPARLALLAPAVVRASTASPWLEVDPARVLVAPGATSTVALDADPSEALLAETTALVAQRLEECTASGVLAPAGCPFAADIDERVIEGPDWTILEQPEVALAPSGVAGRWLILRDDGVIELRARVRQLADGVRDSVAAELEFTLSGMVVIRDDGLLEVTLDEGGTVGSD